LNRVKHHHRCPGVSPASKRQHWISAYLSTIKQFYRAIFKLDSNKICNHGGEKGNPVFARGKDEPTGEQKLGTTTPSCQCGLCIHALHPSSHTHMWFWEEEESTDGGMSPTTRTSGVPKPSRCCIFP